MAQKEIKKFAYFLLLIVIVVVAMKQFSGNGNGNGVSVSKCTSVMCPECGDASGYIMSIPGQDPVHICNGTNGTNGTNGKDGWSPTVLGCGSCCDGNGGISIKINESGDTVYACNGIDGTGGGVSLSDVWGALPNQDITVQSLTVEDGTGKIYGSVYSPGGGVGMDHIMVNAKDGSMWSNKFQGTFEGPLVRDDGTGTDTTTNIIDSTGNITTSSFTLSDGDPEGRSVIYTPVKGKSPATENDVTHNMDLVRAFFKNCPATSTCT